VFVVTIEAESKAKLRSWNAFIRICDTTTNTEVTKFYDLDEDFSRNCGRVWQTLQEKGSGGSNTGQAIIQHRHEPYALIARAIDLN